MDMVNIDIVGAEILETLFEGTANLIFGIRMVLRHDIFLGGDHQAIAQHSSDRLADHHFRAIPLRRVEKVNAEIDGTAHVRDHLALTARLVLQSRQPQPARPAAAQSCHANF